MGLFCSENIEDKSLGGYICELYIDGLVDCSSSIWSSEVCSMLLWFLDNLLVKIKTDVMRVYHLWYYPLSDRRPTIPRHLVMI